MAINIEEAVRTFMDAAGADAQSIDLKLAMLEEEYTEFLEALRWGDPVFVAKEGADLVYVVVSTLISLGIPFNEVFTALQTSNMSKIGPDGQITKSEDGKILKGEDFQPAEDQIREILA